MYTATRNCPLCNSVIKHETIDSQKKADWLAMRSAVNKKLCRSCIATNVNNRRWSDPNQRERQSNRFKQSNPSKGKPAWNRGKSRSEDVKQKISNTKKQNPQNGSKNGNYGNFKHHNITEDFKIYQQRVRVLTERVVDQIPGYDATKRGHSSKPGSYQVDHTIPILQCWYEKWTPEQAADLSNLQFITCKENLAKRRFQSYKIK